MALGPHDIALAERLAEAFPQGFMQVTFDASRIPPEARIGQCHDNAAAYVERNGGSVVTGWLSVSEAIFVKHSIVRTDDGELLDVTPRNHGDESRRSFIAHEGISEHPIEDFVAQLIAS